MGSPVIVFEYRQDTRIFAGHVVAGENMRLSIPTTAQTFESDGMVVIYSDLQPSRLYFNPSGREFLRLIPGLRNGSTYNHVLPFVNHYTSIHGQLRRSADVLYIGTKVCNRRPDSPYAIE